jgi:hypothetical protein
MNFQLAQAFTTFEVTKNNQNSKTTVQCIRNNGLMMTKKKKAHATSVCSYSWMINTKKNQNNTIKNHDSQIKK